MKLLQWFCGILLIVSVLAERRRYDGYQVWLINFQKYQYEMLHDLENEGLIDMMGNEILVSPDSILNVQVYFEKNNIPYVVQNEDIQNNLDEMWKRIDGRKAYDPNDFNTYEDIISEINRLASEDCPAGFDCTTYPIGESLEGRDLVVFSVSQGSGRQALWFDSLIHAREWVAGTTLMRVLDQFIRGYGTDDDATFVLDNYDIYFLPVHNPDGYVFTHTTDRMWRKNRRDNEGSSCMGVDLNRNFDWIWSGPGASSNPCSNTYYGSSAASEPEAAAVQNEVSSLSQLVAYTTVHTVIPAWLLPYGNCTYPPNHDDLMRVASAAVEAIESTHDTEWDYGNGCELLYQTSGSSSGWSRSTGIPYAATPELRGPGFDPPASVIQPAFEEMWNGFVAMIREIDAIGREK